MKRILSKKIPVIYVVVLFLGIMALTYWVTHWSDTAHAQSANPTASCPIKVQRLGGFQLIKPILFADDECPSPQLDLIQSSLTNTIQNYKQYQKVTQASVYLRDLDTSEWTTVNEGENYEPGSLFKVPLLLATLKMDEENPGTLEKKIPYQKAFQINKSINFQSKGIQVGQSYTLRELLTYMIVHSDNNATALVQNNIDLQFLTQLFADMNLPLPDYKAQQYYFTPKSYSLFMRAIYNAAYLNKNNSAYAAKLLSQSTFNDGIVKGLPSGTSLIHKFGEAGNPNEVQLHESAIVYLDNKTYLLTIMTKGKDFKTLSQLLSELSKSVYDDRKSTTVTSL